MSFFLFVCFGFLYIYMYMCDELLWYKLKHDE